MKKMTKITLVSFLVFLLTLSMAVVFFGNHTEEDFPTFKEMVLSDLQKQIQYTLDSEEKKELQQIISKLEQTDEEESFIAILEENFDFDEAEGMLDFETHKQQIIGDIQEELEQIADSSFQAKIHTELQELTHIQTDAELHTKVDALYNELDQYYEENDIDFFDIQDFENFDFDTEKTEIIANLKTEVEKYMQDTEIKNTIEEKIQALEQAERENFFTQLDAIFQEIDAYYEQHNIYPSDDATEIAE